jgi:hypothetical protein
VKYAYRIFGRQTLEKFRRLEDTVRMDLREISFEDARSMEVAKDYVHWQVLVLVMAELSVSSNRDLISCHL